MFFNTIRDDCPPEERYLKDCWFAIRRLERIGGLSMSFFKRLAERAKKADSLLCIGLDPHPEMLPEQTRIAAVAFCRRIIDATSELACAYKPNSAFFEALGTEGMAALRQVIDLVPDDIPVILDAKRGDIASTARAYVRAAFDLLGADAITINPYLGQDAVAPFIQDPERGVFLLCKTSNPGADALQSQILNTGQPLYVHLAQLAAEWSSNENLGLVVGATDAQALAAVRAAAPDMWFLAPGVGAQGGDLEAALASGLRDDGLGILITISRAIAQADDPAKRAIEFRKAINQFRRKRPVPTSMLPPNLGILADALLEGGCVRFGDFTLKSGLQSPIYIDLRRLVSDPSLLARTAAAYQPLLRLLSFDRIAALPYASLPIGTALALQIGRPMVYPRKEVKLYGTKAAIEGIYNPGETVVLIDDLATTGESKFEAIGHLNQAGLQVHDIVVLIDRQSGAKQALAKAGYNLQAVLTLTDLIDYWGATGAVETEKLDAVRAFLNGG
jgi:uridine monophosphate synthetase